VFCNNQLRLTIMEFIDNKNIIYFIIVNDEHSLVTVALKINIRITEDRPSEIYNL